MQERLWIFRKRLRRITKGIFAIPRQQIGRIRRIETGNSILVICQELFEKDFDMFFRNKGNFNRPSGMLCTKPNVSSI